MIASNKVYIYMQLTSNTATPSSTNHTAWMMKPAKKKEQKKNRKAKQTVQS